MKIVVAYDYSCGYSWKLTRLIGDLLAAGEPLEVEWRAFSLDQNDNLHGSDYFIWEHPEEPVVSFPVLAAGRWIAAKYSPEVFARYHKPAFARRHEEHRPLDRGAALEIAAGAGADADALAAALDGGDAARVVAEEHLEGRDRFGIFGTPTVIFEDDAPVFVRLKGKWSGGANAREVWSCIRSFHDDPVINELKRPPTWKPPEV